MNQVLREFFEANFLHDRIQRVLEEIQHNVIVVEYFQYSGIVIIQLKNSYQVLQVFLSMQEKLVGRIFSGIFTYPPVPEIVHQQQG